MNLREDLDKIHALLRLEVSFGASNYHMPLSKCIIFYTLQAFKSLLVTTREKISVSHVTHPRVINASCM